MSTVTLLPDGLPFTPSPGSFTVPGGGTFYGVTSDSSDSTYIASGAGAYYWLSFGTTTIPAGSMVVSVSFVVRARWEVGNGGTFYASLFRTRDGFSFTSFQSPLLGTSFWPFTSPSSTGIPITQADLNDLAVQIVATGATSEYDVSYVAATVVLTTAPTATAQAPTGTLTTTNTPTVTWTYAPGDAGGPQAKWDVRVFTSAQYGAGGFDPLVTTPTLSYSGVGATSSVQVGALVNGTYRAYVRASQIINGVDHWSAQTFTQFVVNATTSDITSVVATQLSATARNQIVVTRNGATPLWTSVEVQKSYDGGTTWSYVRGYTRFAPPSSPFTLYDWEAPNGTAATYRARATYQLSGLDITGAWVTSSAVTWTGTDLWLKDIQVPARNMVVNNVLMPEPTYGRTQGVFQPIGAKYPVVVSDVLQAGRSTITLETYTAAEEAALKLLCGGTVLLLQAPTATGFGWGNRYVAPGELRMAYKTQESLSEWRVWELQLTEVAEPPDSGIT